MKGLLYILFIINLLFSQRVFGFSFSSLLSSSLSSSLSSLNSSSLPSLNSLSSSSSSDPEEERLDNERDIQNWKNFENIERDIQFNKVRTLDVYYDKQNTEELKPVFVFMYGGAWHSGDKIKFTNFGSLLQLNGFVTVIPNYVLYPNGLLEDMVEDVYKAIDWTINNIERYGGDPNRISLAGYSAGSHLTALTLLKSLFQYSNNGVILKPFPTFERIILLNGPYDFDDYSQLFKFFEKSDNSFVEKLARNIFGSRDVSPTDILKEVSDNSLHSLGANKFIFFYTSLDQQVKESSAENFMDQMRRVCPSVSIQYVYKEGYEHTTLTRGIRAGNIEDEGIFMDLVYM